MSAYAVNEVCYRLVHDPTFRAEVQNDARAALAPLALSETERNAMLSGDVAMLRRLGAHEFLLGHLARYRIAGLTVPIYNERMRAAAGEAVTAPDERDASNAERYVRAISPNRPD